MYIQNITSTVKQVQGCGFEASTINDDAKCGIDALDVNVRGPLTWKVKHDWKVIYIQLFERRGLSGTQDGEDVPLIRMGDNFTHNTTKNAYHCHSWKLSCGDLNA